MFQDLENVFMSIFEDISGNGFSVGINFGKNVPTWAISRYPQVWEDTYLKNKFILSDPTIVHGQKSSGHITWRELNQLYPNSIVMTEARKHGLAQGNTMALHIEGAVCIASGEGPAWDQKQQRLARAALAGLFQLHKPENPAIDLDPKLIEIIRPLSQGFRDDEIAEQIGKKVDTVRKRRVKALKLLNAKTSVEMVAKAVKMGLV